MIAFLLSLACTFTSQSDAESSHLRVYDIRDLTGHATLPGLRTDVGRLEGSSHGTATLDAIERLMEAEASSRGRAESLAQAVRALLEPPLGDGQRVELLGTSAELALVGNEAQHERLETFLLSARDAWTGDSAIEFDARIYEVARGDLERWSAGRRSWVLSPVAAQDLSTELQASASDVIQSPRLTVRPFQRAQLSVVHQTSYVKDYEQIEVGGREGALLSPVVDTASTGVELDLTCAPLPGERLALECSMRHTKAERPFPWARLRLEPAGPEVEVQVPALTLVEVAGRFDLKVGESVVLTRETAPVETGDAGDGDRALLVVLSVQRVGLAPSSAPWELGAERRER